MYLKPFNSSRNIAKRTNLSCFCTWSLIFAVDISQERMDDFYEDDLEDDLEDEDGLVPSASALVSKDDFRQRWRLS
jgi:hypothetical protein